MKTAGTTKKEAAPARQPLFLCAKRLFRMYCLNRAYIGTCATIGAYFRVYSIYISFCYCFYGTLINATSASCAVICYNISHFL